MSKRALNGELGYKGERGYSAYEIAVMNGYQGTEEEWANSFTSPDYYYTKMDSDAKFIHKASFAVLTGTVPHDELSLLGKVLSYPSGFDVSNCVVISGYKKNINGVFWNPFNYKVEIDFDEKDYNQDIGMFVQLANAGICIKTPTDYLNEQDNPSENNGYEYRIILMKINYESL